MGCPVCGGTATTEVNVRVRKESDLSQAVGSPWDGRNVSRCDECGVLYDPDYVGAGESTDGGDAADPPPATLNCPDCGSPNDGDREDCSYCGASLESSAR